MGCDSQFDDYVPNLTPTAQPAPRRPITAHTPAQPTPTPEGRAAAMNRLSRLFEGHTSGAFSTPAPQPRLTRWEALLAARNLVNELTTPPLKSNGYPVDGWRAPTWAERETSILRYAAFLLGGADE